MEISDFQRLIADIYLDRDSARGVAGTFLWFSEEVGELARAIRSGDEASKKEEFADVAAWLVSLAELEGISLEEAVAEKYAVGCPKCQTTPCSCG